MSTRRIETERGIRFGCGTFFGMLFGLIVVAIWQPDNPLLFVSIIVIPLFLSGFLALKTADPFWERLADLWPWH